ncbi:hypothetical protein EK904_008733 [Melospiza melodia maxima]|nr:hypothetical protein EK904_008733 [Melospiza melodia maxima]
MPIAQEKTISSALTLKNSLIYLRSFPADHREPYRGSELEVLPAYVFNVTFYVVELRLLSAVFPREGVSNRLPDSVQPESEQVSSGAKPSCLWASRRPGMGLQGTGCQRHSLEVEAKPLGSCKGLGILTDPQKKHFTKLDSGER